VIVTKMDRVFIACSADCPHYKDCEVPCGDARYNGVTMGQEAPQKATPSTSENEPMLYCPVCSRHLAERKCKLFCEQCGYYMSCADYY
jgi:hypothetical protein